MSGFSRTAELTNLARPAQTLRMCRAMTLSHFQREHLAAHPGVANRPVMAGGNAFIDAVYARLSPVYDVIFGAPLQPGRIAAVRQMAIRPGDRVLEVGAGTGINAPLYPQDCHVTAIDLSAPMLNRARRRVARQGFAHVELLEQDAARMSFRNDSFDSVRAVCDERSGRSDPRGARDAARVPAGRPNRDSQSLPQHEPAAVEAGARDLAADRPCRVQAGSLVTRTSPAGGPMARVGREGELPADVVAGDLCRKPRNRELVTTICHWSYPIHLFSHGPMGADAGRESHRGRI